MAKSDRQAARQGVQKGQQTSAEGYGSQIRNTQDRLYGAYNPATGGRDPGAIARGAQERSNLLGGYGELARTGGVSDAEYNRLLSGNYSGFGGSSAGNFPNYLDVYSSLSGPGGGIGSDVLSRLQGYAGKLASGGNYGDVNQGISGLLNARSGYSDVNDIIDRLTKFGQTGGLTPEDIAGVKRPYFEELEKTGGYSPEDISNIRYRGAASAGSTFESLADRLGRQRAVGQFGPGYSEAAAKLARQGAQNVAEQGRETELGLSEAIRQGKLTGAQELANRTQALADLRSRNTLAGYGAAGQFGLSRENAIQDAMARAASLGLGREAQIQAGLEAASRTELGTQDLISRNRLAGAGGLQSATERQRELDAANQRFLIGQRTQGQAQGLGGLLQTYGAMPEEERFYQNLLSNYLGGQTQSNLAWNSQNLDLARMPGPLSSILGGISSLAGGAGGLLGGLGSFKNRGLMSNPSYRYMSPEWYSK
jgi:hypothetical protein